MHNTNNQYNKALKPLARNLRKDSSKAEVRLWSELLSGKRLGGYGFLRQHSINNYIVDFMCKELQLIIEVDGCSHNSKTAEDERRDAELRALGFTVLRISDEEIMKDLSNVQRMLAAWIEQHSG